MRLAALCLSIVPVPSWACATCGCTVNSDAAMGYSSATGWRVNLEYTYIDQDQLRSGTGTTNPAAAVNNPSNPALGGGEIEKQTINRYLTLGLTYRPDSDWNFNLLVPYISRDHTTYGTQLAPYTPSESEPDQISGAHVSNLGDIKLIGNYQGLLPTHNLGVQLGVKLPTGQYGTAVGFYDGPNAGAPLDASLQAGTGSTDVIVGAYYFQAISQNFDAFANIQFQSAVAHKQDQPGNDFRPGNSATLSFGLRGESSMDSSTSVEPVAQERRSGRSCRYHRYGRYRGLPQSGTHRAHSPRAIWLRRAASSALQQSQRVSALPALDRDRRTQLCVLT
jgi:hypothetical protein